jgi:hypothetical protein
MEKRGGLEGRRVLPLVSKPGTTGTGPEGIKPTDRKLGRDQEVRTSN